MLIKLLTDDPSSSNKCSSQLPVSDGELRMKRNLGHAFQSFRTDQWQTPRIQCSSFLGTFEKDTGVLVLTVLRFLKARPQKFKSSTGKYSNFSLSQMC